MWFDNLYSISLKSCKAVLYSSMKVIHRKRSDVWLCEGSIKCYTANFIEQNQITKLSSKKQSIKYGPKPDLTKWSSLDVFTNIKHFSSNKFQSYFNRNCSVIYANQLVSFPTNPEERNGYYFIQLQSFTKCKKQTQYLQWKLD